MKRLLFAIALLALPCYAQNWDTISATNASCVYGACVSKDLPENTGTVSVVVSGTFTATLAFELTADGTTWAAASPATSTAAGTFTFNVAAKKGFRVRASAYTNGSAKVVINTSTVAYSSSVTQFAGVPSGTCGNDGLAVDTTNGHLYACNGGSWLEVGPGAAGSAAFNTLTGGTNAGQALVIGNGSSLTVSGTGTNNATHYKGSTGPTAAQFNFLDATSSIQTQMDAKAPIANPTFTTGATAPIINATTEFRVNGTKLNFTHLTAGDIPLGAYSLIFSEIAAPANPSAGSCKMYMDSTTHKISFLDSAGASCIASGGYATVDDEGTPLTQRTAINFAGAGVTCADDTDKTTCTIPGGGAATAGGTDTQVQFNDGGTNLGGDAGMTYNKTTDTLTLGKLVSGSIEISGTGGADKYTPITDATAAATTGYANGSCWYSSDATPDSLKCYDGSTVHTVLYSDSPTMVTPALGTPASGVITNLTGTCTSCNVGGTAANVSGTPALPNGTTATTQTDADNSTKLATTAYVDGHAVAAASVPAVTVTVSTATPVTVSTTLNSAFYFNQIDPAGTAMTFNLPTAAAGKQFCFANSYNGTAANTGALTIATSAAGQYIIFNDGTPSATGGNVASGGAARDAACVVGVDATHWMFYDQKGTWTKN